MLVCWFINSNAPWVVSSDVHQSIAHLEITSNVLESHKLLSTTRCLDEVVSLSVAHDTRVSRLPSSAMNDSGEVRGNLLGKRAVVQLGLVVVLLPVVATPSDALKVGRGGDLTGVDLGAVGEVCEVVNLDPTGSKSFEHVATAS